jgi:hypothetical protein
LNPAGFDFSLAFRCPALIGNPRAGQIHYGVNLLKTSSPTLGGLAIPLDKTDFSWQVRWLKWPPARHRYHVTVFD